MQYNRLGRTNIDVSLICLGTMTFGEQNTEAEAHEQLDFAMDQGINFIDTAELYPVPSIGETQGKTEEYIGSWINSRKNREELVLATKVAAPAEWAQHIRNGPRLNREHIQAAVDASLQRLQTDYIDLYQVHWPERDTNFFGKLGFQSAEKKENETEILETLQALDELVKSGKVRHIGISNETPWGAAKYLALAESHSLPRIVSVQNPYNLLNRTYEVGLSEFSQYEDIGLLAYSPLGFGVLTGKYMNDAKPENARLTLWDYFSRYNNIAGTEATVAYIELAKAHNLSPTQMALAFVNSRPFLTSNIIGATSMQQLKENMESINVVLNEEILNEIEEIHTRYPNPCP